MLHWMRQTHYGSTMTALRLKLRWHYQVLQLLLPDQISLPYPAKYLVVFWQRTYSSSIQPSGYRNFGIGLVPEKLTVWFGRSVSIPGLLHQLIQWQKALCLYITNN